MMQDDLWCDPWHDTSCASCYKIGNNPAPGFERLWLMAVVWPGVAGGGGDLVWGHRGGVERVTCVIMRWVTRNCSEWDNKARCQSAVSPLPWCWGGLLSLSAGGSGWRVTRGSGVTRGCGGKAVNTGPGPGAWREAGVTSVWWSAGGRGAGPIYWRSWLAEWSGKWGNNSPSFSTFVAGRKKEGSSSCLSWKNKQ